MAPRLALTVQAAIFLTLVTAFGAQLKQDSSEDDYEQKDYFILYNYEDSATVTKVCQPKSCSEECKARSKNGTCINGKCFCSESITPLYDEKHPTETRKVTLPINNEINTIESTSSFYQHLRGQRVQHQYPEISDQQLQQERKSGIRTQDEYLQDELKKQGMQPQQLENLSRKILRQPEGQLQQKPLQRGDKLYIPQRRSIDGNNQGQQHSQELGPQQEEKQINVQRREKDQQQLGEGEREQGDLNQREEQDEILVQNVGFNEPIQGGGTQHQQGEVNQQQQEGHQQQQGELNLRQKQVEGTHQQQDHGTQQQQGSDYQQQQGGDYQQQQGGDYQQQQGGDYQQQQDGDSQQQQVGEYQPQQQGAEYQPQQQGAEYQQQGGEYQQGEHQPQQGRSNQQKQGAEHHQQQQQEGEYQELRGEYRQQVGDYQQLLEHQQQGSGNQRREGSNQHQQPERQQHVNNVESQLLLAQAHQHQHSVGKKQHLEENLEHKGNQQQLEEIQRLEKRYHPQQEVEVRSYVREGELQQPGEIQPPERWRNQEPQDVGDQPQQEWESQQQTRKPGRGRGILQGLGNKLQGLGDFVIQGLNNQQQQQQQGDGFQQQQGWGDLQQQQQGWGNQKQGLGGMLQGWGNQILAGWASQEGEEPPKQGGGPQIEAGSTQRGWVNQQQGGGNQQQQWGNQQQQWGNQQQHWGSQQQQWGNQQQQQQQQGGDILQEVDQQHHTSTPPSIHPPLNDTPDVSSRPVSTDHPLKSPSLDGTQEVVTSSPLPSSYPSLHTTQGAATSGPPLTNKPIPFPSLHDKEQIVTLHPKLTDGPLLKNTQEMFTSHSLQTNRPSQHPAPNYTQEHHSIRPVSTLPPIPHPLTNDIEHVVTSRPLSTNQPVSYPSLHVTEDIFTRLPETTTVSFPFHPVKDNQDVITLRPIATNQPDGDVQKEGYDHQPYISTPPSTYRPLEDPQDVSSPPKSTYHPLPYHSTKITKEVVTSRPLPTYVPDIIFPHDSVPFYYPSVAKKVKVPRFPPPTLNFSKGPVTKHPLITNQHVPHPSPNVTTKKMSSSPELTHPPLYATKADMTLRPVSTDRPAQYTSFTTHLPPVFSQPKYFGQTRPSPNPSKPNLQETRPSKRPKPNSIKPSVRPPLQGDKIELVMQSKTPPPSVESTKKPGQQWPNKEQVHQPVKQEPKPHKIPYDELCSNEEYDDYDDDEYCNDTDYSDECNDDCFDECNDDCYDECNDDCFDEYTEMKKVRTRKSMRATY